mgnify:FL=1
MDALMLSLSPDQRIWLAGYLSAAGSQAAVAAPPAAKSAVPLTVLYGTESGNSEELADVSAKAAKKRGFKPALKNMADLSPSDLAKFEHLLVIVSTWGEGDPPENAVAFCEGLMREEVDLSGVKFSVCALGDTSYEKFCHTGKEVDRRLAQLGAKRVYDRQDCDVDYDDPHREWLDGALGALAPAAESVAAQPVTPTAEVAASAYGKKNPFPAELSEKALLSGERSQKETWHYELSLEGSGLIYQPGDVLAVLPVNAPDMVEGVLAAAKLKGGEEVEIKGKGKKLLADALREDLEITTLSRAVMKKLLAAGGSDELNALMADDAKEDFKEYLWGRWVADAIVDFCPQGLAPEALVGILRKLPPRLYSIASSPLAHPDEVHLTVASVRYHTHERERKGVASTYLADLVEAGQGVPVFVQPNKNFRLPESDDTPMIMVGPGTGIAPFRAFVEHRKEAGAKGESWLFFGDQHYTQDFLYQLEWQDHLKEGSLTRIDVAFSRDQPEKIYVQDRMREHAGELYDWLERGAHFYVCGDASKMAHDVHEALIDIVAEQGGKERSEAEAYVEALKKAKRYQRDVY